MVKKVVARLMAGWTRLVLKTKSKVYIWWISDRENIKLNGKLILNGLPLVTIDKGARLEIDINVTLTSRNRGYHIGLFSPVKMIAEGEGKIYIGENSRIHGSCIHARDSVTLGSNCLIAANCQIIDNNGHELSFENVENRVFTKGKSTPVVIEDNVWVCTNSIILPGVRIGRGSVVAANSVVVKDVPPMTLVGGNPAMIIMKLENEILSSNNR